MKCFCGINELEKGYNKCYDCLEWREVNKRVNKFTTLLNEFEFDYAVEEVEEGFIIKVDKIIIFFHKEGQIDFKSREEFEI